MAKIEKILNGHITLYIKYEEIMQKEDLIHLIPIAFAKNPIIYKRVLESILKDLNSDILFDKDKI